MNPSATLPIGIFDSGIFILLFNIFIRILSCSREGGEKCQQ